MSATHPPSERPRTPIWIAVVLLVSLAVNLLVAGVAIGYRVKGGGMTPGGGIEVGALMKRAGNMGMSDPRRLLRALPPETRRKAARVLVQRMPELRRANRDWREAQTLSLEALAAKPYDEAALAEAFAESQRAQAVLQEKAQAIIVAMMSRLDETEREEVRKAIARRLESGDAQRRQRLQSAMEP